MRPFAAASVWVAASLCLRHSGRAICCAEGFDSQQASRGTPTRLPSCTCSRPSGYAHYTGGNETSHLPCSRAFCRHKTPQLETPLLLAPTAELPHGSPAIVDRCLPLQSAQTMQHSWVLAAGVLGQTTDVVPSQVAACLGNATQAYTVIHACRTSCSACDPHIRGVNGVAIRRHTCLPSCSLLKKLRHP
jgi:hypothetical protein